MSKASAKQSTIIEPSASADLSRKEWRDLIWPKNMTENQRKAYDPRLIREFGCPAGLLLSQLVFWSEKGSDPEGWIYKTALEIKAEVGLTERQTASARDSLVDEGILKAELRPRRDTNGRVKHPSRVYHYLVDLEALAARLGIEAPSLNHDSKPDKVLASNQTECEVQTAQSVGIESNTLSGSYTESTSRDNCSDEPAVNDASQARAEPAPLTIDEEVSTDLNVLDCPDDDQHHSQVGETQQETTAAKGSVIPTLPSPPPPPPKLTPVEVKEMVSVIFDRHTEAGRMARAHVEGGEPSVEQIAEALCIQLQKPEGFADRCLEKLLEALEELRLDPVGVTS
jgi:hypothetical protein